jgi:hypothetical protein
MNGKKNRNDNPEVPLEKKNISVTTSPTATMGNPIVVQLIFGLDGIGAGEIRLICHSFIVD